MVQLNFNAQGVAPNKALEAIPTAWYPVMIVGSSEKPTKAGTGSFIELEMQVQGGEYNGRKLFDRLNIRNPNQTAVDIAYATLSSICHVTGRLHIQDTAQLHGVPFMALAKKRVRDDLPPPAPGEEPQYSNEVAGYRDINGNDPGFAGNVAQPASQPQWAGGGAPAQQQAPVQQYQQPQQQAPQQQYQQPVQQQYIPPQEQLQQYQQPVQQPVQQQAPVPGNGAPPTWAAGAPVQQQAPQQFQQPQQQVPVQQGAPAGQTPPPWAGGPAA